MSKNPRNSRVFKSEAINRFRNTIVTPVFPLLCISSLVFIHRDVRFDLNQIAVFYLLSLKSSHLIHNKIKHCVCSRFIIFVTGSCFFSSKFFYLCFSVCKHLWYASPMNLNVTQLSLQVAMNGTQPIIIVVLFLTLAHKSLVYVMLIHLNSNGERYSDKGEVKRK